MKPIIATKENIKVGTKVVPGRDWQWDDQHEGSEYGVIVEHEDYFPKEQGSSWVNVKWKNGRQHIYLINNIYDLYLYQEEEKEEDMKEIDQKSEYPKEMWVWDDISNIRKELVLAYLPNQEYPYLIKDGEWAYLGFKNANYIEPELNNIEVNYEEVNSYDLKEIFKHIQNISNRLMKLELNLIDERKEYEKICYKDNTTKCECTGLCRNK